MPTGITLTDYNPAWPALFEAEARRLRAAFGADALRIDHVGSTSVPGLVAKPVIDIQISVPTLLPQGRHTQAMAALGYKHMAWDDSDAVYPFFHMPADWPSTHHVHLCEAGGVMERKHLAFRDWLRTHPQTAAAYAALKRKLARKHGGADWQSREDYSLSKTDFVEGVLREAGFESGVPG